MTKDEIMQWIDQHFDGKKDENDIQPEQPEILPFSLFDRPLIGFGDANDAYFTEYKKDGVIGPWFMSPEEWLPGARTVISLFFPFTEQVRKSNRNSSPSPSVEWTYGRVEGQKFVENMAKDLGEWLQGKGIAACVPGLDKRFLKIRGGMDLPPFPQITEHTFSSNWSERHAAFVCGLGTFGLSKGLITEKGMAGRFASIILDEPFEATVRLYTGIYEYCTMCGACIRRCPVDAISKESGKKDEPCRDQIDEQKKIFLTRFGCGKCQVGVPCEYSIPKRRK